MRSGRRRKSGPREANGRVQRISEAERDTKQAEMRTVLQQQHRRGSTDQRLESPIGRFTVRNKLPWEYYDAALEFGSLCRFYLHALGAQRVVNEGTNGSGLGVTAAKTRWLAAEVERLETVLQKLNPAGFAGLRALCVFEQEICQEAEPSTIIVLMELGQLLKKVGR